MELECSWRRAACRFGRATEPFALRPAPKAIGDCLLLAFAREIPATLVTFDRGLQALARRHGGAAVWPG